MNAVAFCFVCVSVVRGRTRSVLPLRTCVNCLQKVTAEMPMACAVMHTTERATPLEVRADTSGTPVQFVSLNAGATPAVAIARPLTWAFSSLYYVRRLCPIDAWVPTTTHPHEGMSLNEVTHLVPRVKAGSPPVTEAE